MKEERDPVECVKGGRGPCGKEEALRTRVSSEEEMDRLSKELPKGKILTQLYLSSQLN